MYRTAMGLGADRSDGWDASKVTGLTYTRLPFRRCASYHVSTEAKMASTTSAHEGRGRRWMSSTFRVAKRVSATALSRQVPSLPTEQVMPASRCSARKSQVE